MPEADLLSAGLPLVGAIFSQDGDHRVVNPMNAGLLQTSYASFLEIQTHRNIDPLLRKQVVQLEAAQVIEKIGGRGGT
jgi:hypothetical protein